MDFIRNMVYARTDANEKHNGCVCDRTHQRAKRYQYIGGLRNEEKMGKNGVDGGACELALRQHDSL